MWFEQFDEEQVPAIWNSSRCYLSIWDSEGALAATHSDAGAVTGVIVELAGTRQLPDLLRVVDAAEAVHHDAPDIADVYPRTQRHDTVRGIECRRVGMYFEVAYLHWIVSKSSITVKTNYRSSWLPVASRCYTGRGIVSLRY